MVFSANNLSKSVYMHWGPLDAAGHNEALNRRWDKEPIAGDDLWHNNADMKSRQIAQSDFMMCVVPANVTSGFYMHDWKLSIRMRRHAE